ncbi:serine hydrolase [Eggerthella guodeyinii]|uniref:Serine hydrolase n=1 Tax=Eggerthella guodeyinii TaxID=2690837 RepID=A0A6L7ISS3_9ACTN|nr:serine hydrolase [Eggerthella guodeyinii]
MKRQPALVAGVLVGAAAVLAIGVGTMAANAVHAEDPIAVADEAIAALPEATAQTDGDAAANAEAEAKDDPRVVAEDARTALDAASGTEDVNLFSSVTGIARTLASDEIADVESAIAAFHDAGFNVGFVMYDLTTREGVGYNADQQFFSASTVKAPFVAFAAQDMVDGGKASFDDEVVEDVILDGTGVMASDDIDRYDLQTVMSNTIVHSDNTGYGLLRERFDQGDFEAWCAAADVDAAAWQGEWYPSYTPRDLAKLWLNIGAYVAEGEGNAAWLSDVLQQTDLSFLREALGDRHRVLSKPGYEIDTLWYDMGALNDAGLVIADTDAYVLVIMSDADYDDEYFTDNEHLIVDLASALGATHDRLLFEGGAA